MPLLLKLKGEKGEWHQIGMLCPGDRPATLSDNKPERREVFMLRCMPDDQSSEILRSNGGIDIEHGDVRELINLEGFELVKILRKNQSYEMDITRVNGGKATLRFIHE